MLSGLAVAHSVGIVHRDMKPDNVFVLEDDSSGSKVKILDFGVAKNLQSTGASGVLTKPGATIGTPSYMSPEQARAAEIDARADVWSTGALLFHAAAGRPPFQEANTLIWPRCRWALTRAWMSASKRCRSPGSLEKKFRKRWLTAFTSTDRVRPSTSPSARSRAHTAIDEPRFSRMARPGSSSP